MHYGNLTNKITLTIINSRQGDVLLFPGPLRKCHKARGNPFPRLKLTENRNRLQTFEFLKGRSRTFPRHPRSRRASKRPVRLILVLLFRGRWAMRSGGSPLLTVHLLQHTDNSLFHIFKFSWKSKHELIIQSNQRVTGNVTLERGRLPPKETATSRYRLRQHFNLRLRCWNSRRRHRPLRCGRHPFTTWLKLLIGAACTTLGVDEQTEVGDERKSSSSPCL